MLQKDLTHYRYLDSCLFQSMASAVEQHAVQAERGVKAALRIRTPRDIYRQEKRRPVLPETKHYTTAAKHNACAPGLRQPLKTELAVLTRPVCGEASC